MGLSILSVLFFHNSGVCPEVAFRVFGPGEVGADVLFILSGLGLCHSYNNNVSVLGFYKRRINRVLLPWWFFLLLMELRLHYCNSKFAPMGVLPHVLYYTGVGWWLNPIMHDRSCWYEWYVPTIMLLYMLFPVINKLSTKKIKILLFASVIIVLGLSALNLRDSLNQSYSRIPAFLFGILCYRMRGQEKMDSRGHGKVVYGILFCIGSILYVVGRYILSSEYPFSRCLYRLAFLAMSPIVLMCLCYFLNKFNKIRLFFVWMGSFTLELYLWHVADWQIVLLQPYIPNNYLCFLVSSIVSIVTAYLLSLMLNWVKSAVGLKKSHTNTIHLKS